MYQFVQLLRNAKAHAEDRPQGIIFLRFLNLIQKPEDYFYLMGIIWYIIYFSLEHIFFLMSILVHKFKNDNQYLNNGSKISNLRKQTRLLEKFFKYVGHTYMDCTMQSISKVGWFVSNTENQKKSERKKASLRVTIYIFFKI